MIGITPLSELDHRLARFRQRMTLRHPEWEMAVVFSKMNLLYFCGTMPEGMLLLPRDGAPILWVRRSYERSSQESEFRDIRPMSSYRDAADVYQKLPGSVFLETEFVPLSMYQRFQRHFPFSAYYSMDYDLAMTKAVKSPWELAQMEEAGRCHQRVLEERVPDLLEEGMSEFDLIGRLYQVMLEEGHMGVARFNMFDTEMVIGQLGFGDSSLYPTSFNGPGGNYGLQPAMPGMGSRERRLKKGELVFVDMGFAINGYHTDKTTVYQFGGPLPDEALRAHDQCVAVQNKIASALQPGALPSEIYRSVMAGLSPDFLENFMGFGKRRVKFLGHGIGLAVDEFPVLAEGFDEPLEANTVFAVEPKKGVPGIGMVGIENSFVVEEGGGRCLTGLHPGMKRVGW